MSTSLKDRIKASRREKPVVSVKPMWEAWRIAHQDHQWSEGAIELAVHILQRRQKGYPHARHSPSTANHCIRRSVLQYLGYKGEDIRDANTLGKFDGGNFGHLKWQMYFYDMGILRDAEVPAMSPTLRSAGTCDGIMEVPLEGWHRDMMREDVLELIASGVPTWVGTLEIKEMFSRRWANNRTEVEPKTNWQGDLYTSMNQAQIEEVAGTLFWFENKDTNEIIEHAIAPTTRSLERIAAFYGEANDYIDRGELPARPYKDSDYECRYCPLLERCKKLEAKGRTTIKPSKTLTYGTFSMEDLPNG